ncbi:aldo/keto reductase [Anaerococcus marasmi]|uniref:aldo/keto reductase n=1 Tax=Anaerococcus marasmi TaxID=2057797 RepID=UPI000CFA2C42|nr:aldo/keto reductase [Anaerococcus marasmi]
MKYYTLNDGLKVPAMGMGTYKIEDEKLMEEVIQAALELGYEYFDTAKYYNNEAYIGKALENAPAKREDYMLATKVWPKDFGIDETKRSIDESLKDLRTDYLDVIHLHWFGKDFDKAWKVFMDYKDQGIVKSIAVCNFMPEQLVKLLELGEAPSMDQLESHLFLQDPETRAFLKENNIKHQAWSPLARTRGGLLDEEILKELSDKYNKTPAQIALRWNIDQGTMIIPKSVHAKRLKENIDIFDFELEECDMHALASLDRRQRFSNDPLDEDWLEEIRNM